MHMNQRVIKIGNSEGIIIPDYAMKKLRLKIGDDVKIETDKSLGVLKISPLRK